MPDPCKRAAKGSRITVAATSLGIRGTRTDPGVSPCCSSNARSFASVRSRTTLAPVSASTAVSEFCSPKHQRGAAKP